MFQCLNTVFEKGRTIGFEQKSSKHFEALSLQQYFDEK